MNNEQIEDLAKDDLDRRAIGIWMSIQKLMRDRDESTSRRCIEAIKLHLIDLSLDLRQEHWHNGYAEGFCEGRVRDDK